MYTDPGTGAEVTPAGSTPQEQNLNANKAGLNYTPAVIATSNASRTDYNNNVNTIKTATNQSVGNANQNQGLNPDGTPKTQITPTSKPSPDTVTMNEGTARSLFGSDFTGVTTNADGTFSADKTAMARVNNPTGTTTASADGTTTTSTNGGTTSAGDTLDPSVRTQLNQNITDLTQRVSDAQDTLTSAKANAANDPALASALSDISTKFDKLISQMQSKNDIVAGQNARSLIQGGAIIGQMGTNFMSDQTDKAMQRVADLQNEEASLKLKATQAYASKDVQAIAAAAKDLNTSMTEKSNAVLALNKAINDNIKQNQADIKATQTAANQAIVNDTRLSTQSAKSVADAIKESGVTDTKTINDYIDSQAKALGISNPEALRSAVSKEQGLQSKADLSTQNTQSLIASRNKTKSGTSTKPKVDGSLNYTGTDLSKITSLLNEGGTTKSGQVFAARGTDGYVDPQSYIHAYNNWVANGGTPKGFIKEFPPVGNVNPQSYSILPPAIKPK